MLRTGDILDGRYEIKEQLGSGGGGIVYKAYHRTLKKDVAVKLIKDTSASELENRTEIDLMKNLKSKYLPMFYDFAEADGRVYTIMEYISGHDILSLMQMGKSFDEKAVLKSGRQMCEAVAELHSQRPPIIHGDIKPANVMYTPADNICLVDFNISTLLIDSKAVLKGFSAGYASPEQSITLARFRQVVNEPEINEFHEETRYLFAGESSDPTVIDDSEEKVAYIDARTDIYGIGATMYFMLTGISPKEGQLSFAGISVSEKLKNIIIKALAENPDDRFVTVEEMKEAIDSSKPVPKPKPTPAPILAEKKPVSKGAVAAAAILIVGIAGMAGIAAMTGGDKAELADAAVSYFEPAAEKTVADTAVESEMSVQSETTAPAESAAPETEAAVTEPPVADGFVRLRTPSYRIDLNEEYISGYKSGNDPLNDYLYMDYRLDDESFSDLSINYVKNAVDNLSGYDNNVANYLSEWIGSKFELDEFTLSDYQIVDEHTENINGRECTALEVVYYVDMDIEDNEYLSDYTYIFSCLIYGFVEDRDMCIFMMSGSYMDDYGARYSESLWERKYLTGLHKLVDSIEIGNFLAPENIAICGDTYSYDTKNLDLSGKKLSGEDVFALSYFKNIEEIDLSDSDITDISMLTSMTNLQALDISNTDVENLYGFENLNSLKILNLENASTDSVYGINTKTIEYLNLSGSEVPYLGYGEKFPNLKGLILSDKSTEYEITKLSSEYGISELEFLAADGISIEEWSVDNLANLPKVKRLFLTDTGLNKPEYYKNLPVTEELYVGGNRLSEEDLEEIRGYVGSGCKVFGDNDYDVDNPPYNFPEIG